uniref:PQ loop repeat protein n=1 Tax=Bursaphelenchus xylophilus TaxID=6326 RepID=A0A1I7SRB8_BURXY
MNPSQMTLKLSEKPYFSLSRSSISFSADSNNATVDVTGKETTSREFVDIESCHQPNGSNCTISADKIFIPIVVMHNHVFKWLIELTGWTYFVAWSLSFYPQAIMNFRRKSVIGFSLDYGLLNIIGFLCYSIYNCLLYFDPVIQDLYIEKHPRGAIPVLLNDVVFAVHAFVICSITGIQCLIYTRGSQRVSYVCWAWISIFGVVAAVSLLLRVFGIFDWLQFISALSYIKLAVTCSKYIPPAFYNFQRKSTIGWSIGTIFLDFSGGIMGLLQMVLQAANTVFPCGDNGNHYWAQRENDFTTKRLLMSSHLSPLPQYFTPRTRSVSYTNLRAAALQDPSQTPEALAWQAPPHPHRLLHPLYSAPQRHWRVANGHQPIVTTSGAYVPPKTRNLEPLLPEFTLRHYR